MARRKGQVGSFDDWDDLIGELYESVLNPVGLTNALAKVDTWMGSAFCHLMVWDNHANCQRFGILTTTALDDALAKYKKHYGEIDPRRKLTEYQPTGVVWACHDYFDDKYVSKSEFYQDLLVPSGIRYILQSYVLKEESISAYVAFNHLNGQGHFSDEQRGAAIRLMPHLQRVLKMLLRSESFRGAAFAGATGLDALEQAVFSLDASGKVIFMNAAGRQIISFGRCLKTRGGKLEAFSSNEISKLSNALARARTTRQSESFALYGEMSDSLDPRNTYLVTILPVPKFADEKSGSLLSFDGEMSLLGSQFSANAMHGLTGFELLVLVSPQTKKTCVSASSLRSLFGFTSAEARLGHELAKGVSVEEYAEAAAVSVATVRTQLRSLLSKTREKRLQDLVRMLATLPGQ